MRRGSILILAVTAMLFGLLLPAQAHAPRQTKRASDFVFRIRCDGFTLKDQVHYAVHIQRFFTEQGELRRVTLHNRWEGTITNGATGEVVASDPGHWQDTIVRRILTTRGQLFSIKIAALGVFIQGVGKIVTDLRTGEVIFESSSADHHQDYEDLCDALEQGSAASRSI